MSADKVVQKEEYIWRSINEAVQMKECRQGSTERGVQMEEYKGRVQMNEYR